ncbi:MAG: hypothetical protein ABMA64_33970 [Myxococcota bacterium]
MSEPPSRAFRWVILGLAAAGALIALGACVGPVVAILLIPVVGPTLVLSDEPLPGGPRATDPARGASIAARVCPALEAGERVSLTGDEWIELAALTNPWVFGSERFSLVVEAGGLTLELSNRMPEPPDPPKYLNTVTSGAFAIEDGRFTTFTIDRFELDGVPLGLFVRGQDLAPRLNETFMSEENADARAVLAAFRSVRIVDDRIVVAARGPWAACVGAAPAPE